MTNVGAEVLSDGVFGQGTGPIFIDGLPCSGTEDNILDCNAVLGYHFCSHDEDVAVRCIGKTDI